MANEQIPPDNTPNYWHTIRANTYRRGLRLHHDREEQIKEMKLYAVDDLRRISSVDTMIIRSSFWGGIALGIIGLVVLLAGMPSIIAIIIGLLLMVGGPASAYFLYLDRTRHRRRTIKYSLVSQAIDRYFRPEVYRATKKLPSSVIEEADIVESEASDYFAGTWKTVPFQFCDMTLYGQSEETRQKIVLFSGQLFILELQAEVPVPILIREREELLSPELYEARKNSPRFFLTGNTQFDRQFAVSFGEDHRASGFEETGDESLDDVKVQIHRIIDEMVVDILKADVSVGHAILLNTCVNLCLDLIVPECPIGRAHNPFCIFRSIMRDVLSSCKSHTRQGNGYKC